MSLHEFIKPLGKEALSAFAERCATSSGHLKQIAYGNRRPNAALSINLERESAGAITCEQLRPDIDWAYLRNSLAAKGDSGPEPASSTMEQTIRPVVAPRQCDESSVNPSSTGAAQ